LISRDGSRMGLNDLVKWNWELPIIFFLLGVAVFAFVGSETEPSGIAEEGDESQSAELNVVAVYEIASSGVGPYSHEVDSGSAVMFRNERSESVSVEGDRWDEVLEIDPGGEEVREVDRITYFDVVVEDDVVGRGRVNVR